MSAFIRAAALLALFAMLATAARSDGIGGITGRLGQDHFTGGVGGRLAQSAAPPAGIGSALLVNNTDAALLVNNADPACLAGGC